MAMRALTMEDECDSCCSQNLLLHEDKERSGSLAMKSSLQLSSRHSYNFFLSVEEWRASIS